MGQPDGISMDADVTNEEQQSLGFDAFTPAEEANAVIKSENINWPQEEGDTVALIYTP